MSEVETSTSLLLLSSSLFLSRPLPVLLPRRVSPSFVRNAPRRLFLPSLLSRSILRTRVVGAERIPTYTVANKYPPFRPCYQPSFTYSFSSLFLYRRSPLPTLSALPPLPRVPFSPCRALATPDRRTRRDPTVLHTRTSSPSPPGRCDSDSEARYATYLRSSRYVGLQIAGRPEHGGPSSKLDVTPCVIFTTANIATPRPNRPFYIV